MNLKYFGMQRSSWSSHWLKGAPVLWFQNRRPTPLHVTCEHFNTYPVNSHGSNKSLLHNSRTDFAQNPFLTLHTFPLWSSFQIGVSVSRFRVSKCTDNQPKVIAVRAKKRRLTGITSSWICALSQSVPGSSYLSRETMQYTRLVKDTASSARPTYCTNPPTPPIKLVVVPLKCPLKPL